MDKLVNLGCHDHFQNNLSRLYYWNFLAQLKQSVEIANEFDLLVIIDGVDTKINACLIVANFSSHHYFKEDNFSLNESNHVRQYCLYHIPGAFGAYFDSSSTLDDIIVIKV